MYLCRSFPIFPSVCVKNIVFIMIPDIKLLVELEALVILDVVFVPVHVDMGIQII